jgi:hypothetical protein
MPPDKRKVFQFITLPDFLALFEPKEIDITDPDG